MYININFDLKLCDQRTYTLALPLVTNDHQLEESRNVLTLLENITTHVYLEWCPQ